MPRRGKIHGSDSYLGWSSCCYGLLFGDKDRDKTHLGLQTGSLLAAYMMRWTGWDKHGMEWNGVDGVGRMGYAA